jgi:xylan 1,4-beta-xylosidase
MTSPVGSDRLSFRILSIASAVLLLLTSCQAGDSPGLVSIHVHADHAQGAFPPVWNFFGYDEPNYTYAPNGKKLLKEIGQLSPVPAYIRVHNLLTSGDGSASLKWGSTNAYTEDASGNPIYDWKIVDRIFDTFRDSRVKPLVEIGFMPEALSTHPQPYRHNFPNGSIYTGWAYPPKDYRKWAELVYQFVKHLRERYGEAETKAWLWEVWNEPDIAYWQGTAEEYSKLYDYSADAVRRALPGARIGGPDSTGPSRPKSAQFLRDFLQHCDAGTNFATGKMGAPLDFISFHPKGSPMWQNDHVQMGIAAQLNAIEQGFKIVASFPKWRKTPVILGESDPEGCAACSAEKNPQNGYRNGALYASYTAEAFSQTLALAEREHINLLGVVTWAFEFEDQPYFAGFRELVSNGLDKPVLNAFRMLGLLEGERVEAKSSAVLATEQVINTGVREAADVRAIATRSPRAVQVLVWNYHDDDIPATPASINVEISGLPEDVQRTSVEHFRIDSVHSNAFTMWKEMGSPLSPTSEQYARLESAGQLQLVTSPQWMQIDRGTLRIQFELSRQSLSLLKIQW